VTVTVPLSEIWLTVTVTWDPGNMFPLLGMIV
jgi:hypothetical protein